MPDNKKKGFTDYQEDVRPGGLGNPVLKYIPDAYQVSAWVKGLLEDDDGPPKSNIDGIARTGKTKGQRN